ncbi:MAG TPA: hypothetical protein VHC42_11935 [Rhizomicrobium sp.]|nr:hypothetical protein [Rhizomicrobium sp.]
MRGLGIASGSYRAGDWVMVRPLGQILATLDETMSLDGMPFMPEMANYCGRRLKVVKSAHKTCDPTGRTNLRRMANAVHLDARCDGSAHGGCETGCLFFWKTDWLMPAACSMTVATDEAPRDALDGLEAATRAGLAANGAVRYRCQATEIPRATAPLSHRDLKQYARDFLSGNASLGSIVFHLARAAANSASARLRRMLRLNSSPAPAAPGVRRGGEKRSPLGPGDYVRIRKAGEIASTLDENGKLHGLAFEDEMFRRCGSIGRVARAVRRIVDERSGRLIDLGPGCVILENSTCTGLGNSGRLFCPRSCHFFWRDDWLEWPVGIPGGEPARNAERS